MVQQKAPFAVGARIAIMPNGYSLVPGIVLKVEKTNSGWRGDVRTADGVLVNRSFHPDYVSKASSLEPDTRAAWGKYWEALEEQGKGA